MVYSSTSCEIGYYVNVLHQRRTRWSPPWRYTDGGAESNADGLPSSAGMAWWYDVCNSSRWGWGM